MLEMLTAIEVFHPERMLSSYGSNKLMSWVQDCLSTGHKTLLIDFQYAPFIDKTGAEALATVVWLVKEHGGEVFLASVRGQAKMLLEITGVDRMFEIYPSQEDFLKDHQVWCCALKGYIKKGYIN